MEEKLIYHGSNVIVENPKIMKDGHYKDFGFGFYCTNLKKQAMRWALSKTGDSIVNCYLFNTNNNLKIKSFPNISNEWLDFVVACRSGEKHSFDIVEGPMADDQIWDYVEDYIDGNISKDAFWELVKFKYPTHQIVFCSDKALETISFKGSESI